jgi:dTDP-4-dehydrorhamnose 3,5-epimerase-like enzyme
MKKIKDKIFKSHIKNSESLLFLESKDIFKKGFKRFFSIYVKKPTSRGFHGHKKCSQILFCLNGKIEVHAYKNKKWTIYKLVKNKNYIIIPPKNFLKIKYCKNDSILGALCDRNYEKKDYYFNLKEIN